jgi:hypothetical protein
MVASNCAIRSKCCDIIDCIARTSGPGELGEAGEDAVEDLDDGMDEVVEMRADLEDVPEYDEASDTVDDARLAEYRPRRVVSICSWAAANRSILALHFSTMSSAWS